MDESSSSSISPGRRSRSPRHLHEGDSTDTSVWVQQGRHSDHGGPGGSLAPLFPYPATSFVDRVHLGAASSFPAIIEAGRGRHTRARPPLVPRTLSDSSDAQVSHRLPFASCTSHTPTYRAYLRTRCRRTTASRTSSCARASRSSRKLPFNVLFEPVLSATFSTRFPLHMTRERCSAGAMTCCRAHWLRGVAVSPFSSSAAANPTRLTYHHWPPNWQSPLGRMGLSP